MHAREANVAPFFSWNTAQKKARRQDAGLESLFAVTHLGTRSGRKSGGRQTAQDEI
jgi:hypothetical protein